jgi:hypothetical protein
VTTEIRFDDRQLFDALDGLFAYHVGATDSGVRDPELEQAVAVWLRGRTKAELESMISRFSRAMEYDSEDHADFRIWIDDLLHRM